MKYKLEDKEFDVVITKKNNKNTYIRIKDEDTIYVTTSYFVTKNEIKKILDNNQKFIKSSIEKVKKTKKKEEEFYYLGKKYNIVIIPTVDDIILEDDTIITKSALALDNWLKKRMIELFKQRYDYIYDIIEEDIIKPTLRIRKMKTRWGVCNRQSKTITLNSELIKYDLDCLDYVIIHEYSHLIYFDHSKNFWKQVEKYMPDYKEKRKKLRN